MRGFGQLLGFLILVLPVALWDWVMIHQQCPQCRGRGKLNTDDPDLEADCYLCGGRGKIKRR